MMRAIVVDGARQLRVAEDLPEPDCEAGEVIVEISAVAVCGTDLAYVMGDRAVPERGRIVGHEAFGHVVATAADVTVPAVGDRVVIEPNYPCGLCSMCTANTPSLCTERRSPTVSEHGFLVERVAVPAAFAWPLPPSVSDADAACIEPLTVVLAAVRRAGDLTARPRIAITGAGAIGRILTDLLARRGIVAAIIDPSAERTARAVELGARPATDGERFDLVFECSGNAEAATTAVEMLDPAGLLVVVGVGSRPFSVEMTTLVRRGLTIVGSMIYDHPHDFAAAISLVAEGDARPGAVLREPATFETAVDALLTAGTVSDKTWIRLAPEATP